MDGQTERHLRAGIATVLGLIFIPWLITDPHWRNVFLGFVGLYVLKVMTERHQMLKPDHRAILITGCDTGIGHGMAKYFDLHGFDVFAGCLFADGAGAKELQMTCSHRTKVVQLDITKQEEVDKAVEYVQESVGDKGLWGIVNNAGILQFAEIDICPLNVFQQHFDVNCLGQIRVVKAFLPLLKRCKGRIVNFSSLNARMYFTMFSAYMISKAGVEVFSDVLRLEMKKWGIKVAAIFPAGFETNMTKYADRQQKQFDEIKNTLTDSQKNYYNDDYFKTVMERSSRTETAPATSKQLFLPSDLSPIYLAVDHALLSATPYKRYFAGFGSRSLMYIMSHCPYWFLDCLLMATSFTCREKGLNPTPGNRPTNITHG